MREVLPSEAPPRTLTDAGGLTPLGPVTRVEPLPDGVILHSAEGAQLRLSFLADEVVHVRLAPPGQGFDAGFSYALDPETPWPGPSRFDLEEDEGSVTLHSPALTVRTPREALRLVFFDAKGRLLQEDEAGVAWDGSSNGQPGVVRAVACSKRLRPGEQLFGLGDKPLTLDRRGHRLTNWNTDAFRYARGSDPLYKSIPFLLGLAEDACWGLFFDNPHRVAFDLGADDEGRLRYHAHGGPLDYYFFGGAEPLDLVRAFTRLTGRPPLWPKWALGYHQCRYSYLDEADLREVAAELRRRALPCDVLYFDIHYMDGYRVFTWDHAAFPEPGTLIADLRADGFRSVVIVDPGVKADDMDYAVAREGLERHAFVTNPDGIPFVGDVWPGPCYFPDFTDPEVRAWWGTLHEALVRQGVAGFWNDMNEPAVFSAPGSEEEAGTFPLDVRHAFEGEGGDHARAHNVYGMQMVRATYEGLRRLDPERRPFTITRAAYAGTQRFSTTWTGDNTATWDHLRLAIQQTLSLGVSGFAFAGADVGGFSGEPDGELMARWTQLGAFLPLFRNHSAVDTARQEPWRFGEEVEIICRAAIELRYRLLPYWYTLLWEATAEGAPLLRPLPLAHPSDETIRRTSPLGFYIGPSLLVHPVVEPGQRSREVYLPRSPGGWFDFHTGERLDGRSTFWIETPLDRIPLYARAGSVVPLQPVVQHTGEPVELLALHVYPTPGAFTARLYEDAGDGWAFLDGGYFLATFECEAAGKAVTVRCTVEGTFLPSWRRWEVVVFGIDREPAAVHIDGRPVPFTWGGNHIRFEAPVGASFEVVR
ncbi:MAG TPA: glycoside hydrolase family 31 protein [Rubricoccaceae bacterium]|nr:glycoside hydrolase family 31 protein [Rubricoccaceae bacterium]